MYKKLLLSAGGGVVPKQEKTESNNVAAIAIGLGGMGVSCLRTLKKEIGETDRCIKFLGIDSESYDLRENGTMAMLDPVTEFWDIRVPMPACEIGTGADRQVGRTFFSRRCSEFVVRLQRILREIYESSAERPKIQIHVFTGLCGGTGGGIFLDVCYVMQYVLKIMDMDQGTRIHGYFFSPEVTISRAPSVSLKECFRKNASEAIKELDHCMNLYENDDHWREQYGEIYVQSQNRPVTHAYLIDARDSHGYVIEDSYDHVIHVAVQRVMSLMNHPALEGVLGGYYALGAAKVYVPTKEIFTYIVSKTFEKYKCIEKQFPTDVDVDLYVQSIGLRYEDITKAVNERVRTIPMFEVNRATLYEQTRGMNPNELPPVLHSKRDVLPMIKAQLNENKKCVSDFLVRIRRKQYELAMCLDKGPHYAGALLYSAERKNLLHMIDEYIILRNSDYSRALSEMTDRQRNVEETLINLRCSNFFNRGMCAEEYVQAVHAYFQQVARIEGLQALGETLFELRKQVEDFYVHFFQDFERVMHMLQETFSDNLAYFENHIDKNRIYEEQIMTVQELRPELDSYIETIRAEELFLEFVGRLLEKMENQRTPLEVDVEKAVSDFFSMVYVEYTTKTITDYLQRKFNTLDCNVLSNRVYEAIMVPLSCDARPLFGADWCGQQFEFQSEWGYCMVPREANEIIMAANNYQHAHPTVGIIPMCEAQEIRYQWLLH